MMMVINKKWFRRDITTAEQAVEELTYLPAGYYLVRFSGRNPQFVISAVE